MKIGKTFTFEAAHRLMRHDGKCRNLHGHSYRVEITLEGGKPIEDGPKTGMLLDFGALTAWWKALEPQFDHMTLLEDTDELVSVLRTVEGITVHALPMAPTAENLSAMIAAKLNAWLWALETSGEVAGSVVGDAKVYEGGSAWASTEEGV